MADRVARRRGRRPLLLAIALLAVLAAGVAWALVPRALGTPRIEGVRLLGAGVSDGGRKPAMLATPVRIAITFSVPEDLERARARLSMETVTARLADCRGAGGEAVEVVAQGAGYLADYGRVRRLPDPAGGGARYRAVFDDELAAIVDHEARRSPAHAAPGGLCLSLRAARMWFGQARSLAVPIGPLPRG